MKNKKKLFMDLLLAIALGFSMAYTFTGGLVHEILGILLLLGLLLHMFRRVKYYPAAIKAFGKKQKRPFKLVTSFVINIILIAATVIMLLSSILISKELFSFIDFSGINISYEILRLSHVICGIVMVVCAFLHVCLHFKMFDGIIRKAVGSGAASKFLNGCSRVIAIAMAVIVVRVSISTAANAADIFRFFTDNDNDVVKQTADMQSVNVKSPSTHSSADTINTNETESPDKPTDSETGILTAASANTANTVDKVNVSEKGIGLLFWSSEDAEQKTSGDELQTENDADTEDAGSENDGQDIFQEASDYTEDVYDYSENDYGDIFYQEDEYIYYDDDYSEETYDDYNDYYYVPTLSDYLAMFTCSGCGRHCSLLSPGCGRGSQQASQYTQEYYSVYGA